MDIWFQTVTLSILAVPIEQGKQVLAAFGLGCHLSQLFLQLLLYVEAARLVVN